MLRPLSAALLLGLLLPPIGVIGEDWGAQTAPSESECRPYIEKALKELGPSESQEETEVLSAEEGQVLSEWNERISQNTEPTEDVESKLESESAEQTKVEDERTEEIQNLSAESVVLNTEADLIPEETSRGDVILEAESEQFSTNGTTEEIAIQEDEASEVKGESNESEDVPRGEHEVTSDSTETEGSSHETQEETSDIVEEKSVEESQETHEEKENEEPKPEESDEMKSASLEENEELKSVGLEESEEVKPATSSEESEELKPKASEESEELKPQASEESEELQPTPSEESEELKPQASEESEELKPTPSEESEELKPQASEESEEVKPTAPEESEELRSVASEESEEMKSIASEESGETLQPLEEEQVAQTSVEEPLTSGEENMGVEETSMEDNKESELIDESEESGKSSAADDQLLESEEGEKKESSMEIGQEEDTPSQEEVAHLETESAESKEAIPSVADSTEEVVSESVVEAPVQEMESVTVERPQEESTTEEEVKEDTAVEKEPSPEEPSGEDEIIDTKPSVEEIPSPEEDLTMPLEIPHKLRPREHISEILRLDKESAETELLLSKSIDVTLRDLKRLYETAIKPLEILYKYRDLSNRHFGDPEIFSKPLILFMGPWSGGKSTIINYLLDNEFKRSALRSGAEPSPAYFNIVMWGEREEVLDGTQLAADWTFSGLQKFGQGLLDRLRGLKLNHPLLEKVNIIEIPGILEIRKQVERLFPFNDACQWFIDRADIIFLVYDPAKLDVGPESEAILDQLKGREYQTRIILNKADQVRPEELMRVQGTLIWNISPLMSSTEPPVMYSTSLWSMPYESGAPTRLLYAQEKAFLKDLRDAIDKRVENKIASARRFAVRVRNHAKMVDCYLTTYYNHKSFFGNRKKVSDDIIEHPQNYHIYEGLSTLTNISRYDLPDPEVYKDFFRLNPVYDFQQLSATCTYFRGCPINRLDVAIAYELPELIGKYKKSADEVIQSVKKIGNS